MAVMELVEEISTAFENKKFTVGVFIDQEKAFETIDHTILNRKMEKYGIRGSIRAHTWIGN